MLIKHPLKQLLVLNKSVNWSLFSGMLYINGRFDLVKIAKRGRNENNS